MVRLSRRMLVGLATIIVVFGAWQVVTTELGLVSPGRFPTPLGVWEALKQAIDPGYPDSTLLVHAGHSSEAGCPWAF